MKKRSGILRISLYTVLVCAFIAAWIAVSVLKVPTQELSDADPAAFDTTTTQIAKNILDTRRDDLEIIARFERLHLSDGPRIAVSLHWNDPREIMSEQNTSVLYPAVLDYQSGGPGQTLEPSGELSDALDAADDLYDWSIYSQTKVQLPYLHDSIIDLRNESAQMFGYRTLASTVQRDILKYRTLNSLAFNDIKHDIYLASLNDVVLRRNVAREQTRQYVMNLEAEMRAENDARLDVLLDETASLIITDARSDNLTLAVTNLDLIINRINNFNSPSGTSQVPAHHVPEPEIDMTSWIAVESDLTSTAENALSIDQSE